MAHISTARKLTILARIAGRRMEQTRTFSAVLGGARTAAVHLGKVLGQLWLEVTGFVFLAIAAIGATASWREYSRYQAGTVGAGRLVIAILFTLMFAWFGISSFLQVKRKRK